MWAALRHYWVSAKGYRLRPWKSPYIRWRIETFFGNDACPATALGFLGLVWRERARLLRFLRWCEFRRAEQKARSSYL